MMLETFINSNDKKLQQACRRIAFKHKKKTKNHLTKEVYSELYLHLYDNWSKYDKLPNEQIYYLCLDFIKKQFIWESTPLKKTIEAPRLKKLTIIYSENVPETNYEDLRIQIGSESGTKFTADYLLDLHNNFTEWQLSNIIKTHLIYDKLNLKDQVIFDLYINQNMSIRDIATKINTSASSANVIIQETITNIKNLINGSNN